MIKITATFDVIVAVDGHRVRLYDIFSEESVSTVKSVHDLYNLLNKLKQHHVCSGNAANEFENVLLDEKLSMRFG